MMRIRRQRVRAVRSDTCHYRGRPRAVRVMWASSTTRPRVWAYARRVSWASIRMWLPRHHASVVLLASMRTLLGRAAAQRARLGHTRRVLVCGRVTRVAQVATLRVIRSHVLYVWRAKMTTTVIRRHLASTVRSVNTRRPSRRTARHVWQVRPTLTATLQRFVLRVPSASMPLLV